MSGKSGVFLYYFTLAMTAIYAILGVFIIFSTNANIERLLPGKWKYIFGVFLILYAAYRVYRLYKIKQGLDDIE